MAQQQPDCKRTYTKWSDAERQQLVKEIQQRHQMGQHVVWKDFTTIIPGKTVRQCYDEYLLLTKKSSPCKSRHNWTDSETQLLHYVFKLHKYDWEYIQLHYFPELDINQLKNKMNSMRKLDKPAMNDNTLQPDVLKIGTENATNTTENENNLNSSFGSLIRQLQQLM